MITRSQLLWAQERASKMLASPGINIASGERRNIEVAEFSSTGRDDIDVFTDPRIRHIPEIAD
jgi:hypothetical protein